MWCLFVLAFCSTLHGNVAQQDSESAAPEVYLQVNGQPYREQEYLFYDGQPTNFTCVRKEGVGTVALFYSSRAIGSISTGFKTLVSVDMYLKLTVENNDTFIECSKSGGYDSPTITITVHLLLTDTHHREGFEVSGLVLPRLMKQHSEPEASYKYTYFRGEPVALKVLRDEAVSGCIQCHVHGDNLPQEFLDYFVLNNETVSFTNNVHVNASLYPRHSGTTLVCTVQYSTCAGAARSDLNPPAAVAVSQAAAVTLSITFIYFTNSLEPLVGGLSLAHLIFMYKNEATYIQYDYGAATKHRGTDRLFLTCGADGTSSSQWFFVPEEVELSTTEEPNPVYLKRYTGRSLIQCVRESDEYTKVPVRDIQLELVRKAPPRVVMTTTRAEVTTPHVVMTTPRAEVTTPHVVMTTPRAEVTTPHVVMTTPRAEVTTPHVVMTTPRAEITTPRAPLMTPRADIISPLGVPDKDPVQAGRDAADKCQAIDNTALDRTISYFSKIVEIELSYMSKFQRIECMQELLGVIKKYAV